MDSNISILGLIIEAGFLVQTVMLILVVMSIYSWTLIFAKKKVLIDAKSDIKNFSEHFLINSTASELHHHISNNSAEKSAMARIFMSGYEEFEKTSVEKNNAERAYRLMNTSTNNEIGRLDSNLSILAMIASSSPYIGLFGTVWGIMHSFIGLASVKQASIAVVAPGIAEALIATAFGLFAAIPASIAYNRLSSQVGEINNKYTAFIEEVFVVFQR
ncbi:MotA/TolQ/ExbB proton channel family protein [uncultured Candidatus Thioglobus sp.]|nr:MotA/TolQ/ExbB proton channel family protein [uncultured Candidatus Thioglobus sp.]